jgi:hypothetical protein
MLWMARERILPDQAASCNSPLMNVSPNVIARAREQTVCRGHGIAFRAADVLNLDEGIASRRCDLVLDQACHHMLVLYDDRRRCLRSVRQVMSLP